MTQALDQPKTHCVLMTDQRKIWITENQAANLKQQLQKGAEYMTVQTGENQEEFINTKFIRGIHTEEFVEYEETGEEVKVPEYAKDYERINQLAEKIRRRKELE